MLDPLGRYLTPGYVADDRLTVGGRPIPGDDPRVPRIARALDQQDSVALSRTLTAEGIGYVVVDRTVPPPEGEAAPPFRGRKLFEDEQISLIEVPGKVQTTGHGASWWAAVGAAWLAFVGILVVPAVSIARRRTGTTRRHVSLNPRRRW